MNIRPMPHDPTLAELNGLCPHDTADEYITAIDQWIAGDIPESTMWSRLNNLKCCASCRDQMTKGITLAAIWA
jgi:hypothetical protein